MARTNFLRPASALFLLAIVPIGAACNGHVVSLGDTGDALQSVVATTAASKASGASGSIMCKNGWAHPNICCSAAENTETSCGAWEENPFRACPSGDTTYPDLLSCCDLNDPSDCTDTSTPDAGTPPPPYGCGFACPPGWWSEPGNSDPSTGMFTSTQCCTAYGAGTQCVPQEGVEPVATTCASGGTLTGGSTPVPPSSGAVDAGVISTPPSPVDAGPAPTEDAGILPGGWIGDDGGCYTGDDAGSYPGYDGGNASLCNACPPNWTASDPTQPELCCQSAGDGLTLCFSQAGGSATGVGVDAGEADDGGSFVSPPTSTPGSSGGSTGWGTAGSSNPDGGPSGPSCTGSADSCSCEETTNGHTYALDCYANSSGSITCTCTIDGTGTSAAPSVDSCLNSNAVTSAFSATTGCGFP